MAGEGFMMDAIKSLKNNRALRNTRTRQELYTYSKDKPTRKEKPLDESVRLKIREEAKRENRREILIMAACTALVVGVLIYLIL